MRQFFTIAGPFGELSGVINLCEVEERQRNVLVMAHGFRGSMEGAGRAAALADEIGESICSVVRFNFSWCTMLSNQVAELKAVLDFVRETLRPGKLFLLGRSFGGATCIVTACGDDAYRPNGMILWSAPNSLKQTFIQVLGEEAFQTALAGKSIVLDDERGHDEIPAEFVTDLLYYDLAELLKKWKKGPLLIIHGEKDTTVTPDQAKENLEIAGGESQLYYMEGDNHHLDLRFKEAGELVKKWLNKNI
ncbi:MAG: alpha/beta hydrolase [Acidaminococcaceae bacterium]|nr:alpha/beta hydrolase [Acidaminococcaceae bacterium]